MIRVHIDNDMKQSMR